MKIYSMTATFGKLENKTLTLQPGLNLVQAPNEWGKSTWCAFLTIMLYGLDTRAKTTKTALADKERYAPWSGTPMSGRMELNWNGRDITIERRAKGRTPMGEFAAYETASGLPVAELTATTCGQVLLGVERSVFQRSSFIQLSDLPVTQDEALRRRLNALVTTGEEGSAAEELAQKLKDLKNKCRYNRSGLLPQAEAQQEALEKTLQELHQQENRIQTLRQQVTEIDSYIAQLENHRLALDYAAAQAGQRKVLDAGAARDRALDALEAAELSCQGLCSIQTARQQLETAAALLEKQLSVQNEVLPLPPVAPAVPLRYQGIAPENAVQEAMKDVSRELALTGKKQRNSLIFGIYAGISILLLAAMPIPQLQAFAWLLGAAIALGGIAVAAVCILRTNRIRDEIQQLYDLHPGQPTHTWLPEAESYQKAHAQYAQALQTYQAQQESHQARKAALAQQIAAFAGERSLQALAEESRLAISAQENLERCRQDYQQKQAHAEALGSLVKTAPEPPQPDTLTLSPAATDTALQKAHYDRQSILTRLGQCQGKMEALGSEASLKSQLEAVDARIRRLNQTYRALELALGTLSDASAELQRRFAPRISQQAQELFSRLTGGRYSRLSLAEDLTVSAGAQGETTLRPALWRSEGTTDQLYLALRLAVSRELSPQAPLILDDAFARFDDERLSAAMEILKEEAQTRQVILFSCQSREQAYGC